MKTRALLRRFQQRRSDQLKKAPRARHVIEDGVVRDHGTGRRPGRHDVSDRRGPRRKNGARIELGSRLYGTFPNEALRLKVQFRWSGRMLQAVRLARGAAGLLRIRAGNKRWDVNAPKHTRAAWRRSEDLKSAEKQEGDQEWIESLHYDTPRMIRVSEA
jgi:hypothetical protein